MADESAFKARKTKAQEYKALWFDNILRAVDRIRNLSLTRVYIGRCPALVPKRAVIFFPVYPSTLSCGLTGIVAFTSASPTDDSVNMEHLETLVGRIGNQGYQECLAGNKPFKTHYLCGKEIIDSLFDITRRLKRNSSFHSVYTDPDLRVKIEGLASRIHRTIEKEAQCLADHMGRIDARDAEIISGRIEGLKDILWCLRMEVLSNVEKLKGLMKQTDGETSCEMLAIYKQINTVLNSIDRLEVRGRDSAGISLMAILGPADFASFEKTLIQNSWTEEFESRQNQEALVNLGINVNLAIKNQVSLTFTYKVAAEIGSLGDNIRYLRRQIGSDRILGLLMRFPLINHTISVHTRWASVGAISEPNCHPVDNGTANGKNGNPGVIHACLNGDIDNYLELRYEHEQNGVEISPDITTDTKMIPLRIEKYIALGHDVDEAFRLAVNDFSGSHAISMQTDLAPGKLFLAQKGSGQAIFVGLGDDHLMPASEVYGFVEETSRYLKLEGEKQVDGQHGPTQGQIFILDQNSSGEPADIRAMYYDGTPLNLDQSDVKHTEITSRDIDRQGFPHYFLKEISEAPLSVERTLENNWKIDSTADHRLSVMLDDQTFPPGLASALETDSIQRVLFVGQGTAGIAAQVCADILSVYLNDPSFPVRALKASELSGFQMGTSAADGMTDALVIAISQSGTTTDTNRTVDMVRERGAHTIAIVNRRDSDITFKVDGVLYTSSGRDIEMSVASTKAFYSQIVAGSLLSLKIAQLKNRRNPEFISREIKRLLELPDHMRTILDMKNAISESAQLHAITKTYWAAVGSGPNKSSADEIRIKLSELCYKTISSDYVEDKKHIDLSSEPLIIVCAAGTRETVLGDLIKDAAIFQAHKATPIVITDAGEDRFTPYAASVFHVPKVKEHLAPVLNTLVGHLWGYYAALSINEGSGFLYGFREDMQRTVDECARQGMDIYEILLEKRFREKILEFYKEYRRRKATCRVPSDMGMELSADLTLLLKYLAGKLPVAEFELDFGKKGTPRNMLTALFECLSKAINRMSRPVDAIKHQAKTVTVGTSRLSEKTEGLLFDLLKAHDIGVSQITHGNILVMRNLQEIVSRVNGSILYQIQGLSALGEPTDDSSIHVIRKQGILKELASRVEADHRLKGTKRIIVRQGNVYIGKGRKDGRSIIVIPVISSSPATPDRIEYLLLLNIGFRNDVPLPGKIKALGGKYEHIKNIVQENSLPWDDHNLELIEIQELFGRSAEKIAEYIVSKVGHTD